DMPAPIAVMPVEGTPGCGPIAWRPQQAGRWRPGPGARHPVVAGCAVMPISGCPEITLAGAWRLFIDGKRRRRRARIDNRYGRHRRADGNLHHAAGETEDTDKADRDEKVLGNVHGEALLKIEDNDVGKRGQARSLISMLDNKRFIAAFEKGVAAAFFPTPAPIRRWRWRARCRVLALLRACLRLAERPQLRGLRNRTRAAFGPTMSTRLRAWRADMESSKPRRCEEASPTKQSRTNGT